MGLITRFTAAVASMFIIILKASHVAGPEKDVVMKVAIDNHKPFLVVINQSMIAMLSSTSCIAHRVSNE